MGDSYEANLNADLDCIQRCSELCRQRKRSGPITSQDSKRRYTVRVIFSTARVTVRLRHLDMEVLETICQHMGKLRSQRVMLEIDINGSLISRLPDSIWKIRGLWKLCVNSCNLTHLPSQLFQVRSLKILHIENNNLTYLPSSAVTADIPEIALAGNNFLLPVKPISKVPEIHSDDSINKETARDLAWDELQDCPSFHSWSPPDRHVPFLPMFKRYCTSTICFLDAEGNAVDSAFPAPSAGMEFRGSYPQLIERPSEYECPRQTGARSLRLHALTQINAKQALEEASTFDISDRMLHQLGQAKNYQEGRGVNCDGCWTTYITPAAEWLEWYVAKGSEGVLHKVPFLRRVCSVECLPIYLLLDLSGKDVDPIEECIVAGCGWRKPREGGERMVWHYSEDGRDVWCHEDGTNAQSVEKPERSDG